MAQYAYPLTNTAIAEQIDLLGKLMDIFGENAFKVKAYTNAAYSIKKMPQNLIDLAPQEVQELKVIGDSVRAKVLELLEKGSIDVLEQYKLDTPPGVLDIMKIKGLGPKKIAVLWKDLGITTLGELEYACEENRLMTFKGFGAKTQAEILKNIAFLKNSAGQYLWKQIDDVWNSWKDKFESSLPNNIFPIGAYVRHLPILNGIHIAFIGEMNELTNFLTQNGFSWREREQGFITAEDNLGIPWTFQWTNSDDLGHLQLKENSSPDFYNAFIAAYGSTLSGKNEIQIFENVGLPFIPAYIREQLPISVLKALVNNGNLIASKSIKGIIHSHSTWSDGLNTIEDMAIAARDLGMEYLVISDHSKSAFYANGLSVERILAQHKEIDALNEKLAPFKIFKSIEADILNDGSLDYDASVLATFDLVIASIHSNLKMTEEKAMERLLTAVANPYTTILGHPTGRLLLSRPGYPVDYSKLIATCAEHKVVLEINAHPRRLDLDWTQIAAATAAGVKLSINPDAHAVEHLQLNQYGVAVAQKAGLLVEQNLSSFSLEEFESYLQQIKTEKGI